MHAPRGMQANLCRAVPWILGVLPLLPGCWNSNSVAPDASLRDDAGRGSPADAGVPSDPCWSGSAVPCACAGGSEGLRYCEDATWLDACECSPRAVELDGGVRSVDGSVGDAGPPGTGECIDGDEEWCDGRDNDCDLRIDEGHACPDPSVAHTSEYSGAVFLHVRAGVDGPVSLRPLGAVTPGPLSGFDEVPTSGGVHHTDFSAGNDGTIFYRYNSGVWHRWEAAAPDPEVLTPPCFDGAVPLWVSSSGSATYLCAPTLRRDDGRLLIADVGRSTARAVTDEGRVFLQAPDGGLSIRDVDGTSLEVESLGEWTGRFTSTWMMSPTVDGEHVYYALPRVYRGSSRHELVVFRIDATNGRRQLVRRVPVRPSVRSWIALPDGRVYGTYAQRIGRPNAQLILEYPLGEAARSVWSDEREGTGSFALIAVRRGAT